MDVFSTKMEIRLSFVKTSEFRGGGGGLNPQPPGTPLLLHMELVKKKSVQVGINTWSKQLDGLYERVIYRLLSWF
jgi:hypothetical protein